MCSIVACIGPREAFPIVLKGLQRLEYRGYAPSGNALLDKKIKIYKNQGKVSELESSLIRKHLPAKSGIGPTRWATHGEPSDRNGHPYRGIVGFY